MCVVTTSVVAEGVVIGKGLEAVQKTTQNEAVLTAGRFFATRPATSGQNVCASSHCPWEVGLVWAQSMLVQFWC